MVKAAKSEFDQKHEDGVKSMHAKIEKSNSQIQLKLITNNEKNELKIRAWEDEIRALQDIN